MLFQNDKIPFRAWKKWKHIWIAKLFKNLLLSLMHLARSFIFGLPTRDYRWSLWWKLIKDPKYAFGFKTKTNQNQNKNIWSVFLLDVIDITNFNCKLFSKYALHIFHIWHSLARSSIELPIDSDRLFQVTQSTPVKNQQQ